MEGYVEDIICKFSRAFFVAVYTFTGGDVILRKRDK
jgi:hypothetical protein